MVVSQRPFRFFLSYVVGGGLGPGKWDPCRTPESKNDALDGAAGVFIGLSDPFVKPCEISCCLDEPNKIHLVNDTCNQRSSQGPLLEAVLSLPHVRRLIQCAIGPSPMSQD